MRSWWSLGTLSDYSARPEPSQRGESERGLIAKGLGGSDLDCGAAYTVTYMEVAA